MSTLPSDAALAYRRLGLSVVPIARGFKFPPRDCTWTPRQSVLPTEAQIAHDYELHPTAGVAIITGRVSGVVVLDIDPKRCLPQDLDRFLQDLRTKYARCPRVTTGGGGIHVYFSAPSSHAMPNAVNLRPGFDLRADGGLVVAPPTVHASGRAYKWEVPFNRVELLPLPAEFTPAPSAPVDGPREHWIEDALRGVAYGGRNDTCAKLAGFFLGKGIPAAIVTQLLATTFAPACDPPMDLDEVQTTVTSVAKKEFKASPPKEKRQEFEVTHVDDFMAMHSTHEVAWTIDEWLPEGAVTFLVAPPGTYKTWLLLDLALSLATGADFLGKFKVNAPGPVIVVQQEDHKGGIASRLAQIWGSRFPVSMPKDFGDPFQMPAPKVPIWIHETRSLRLDSQESIAALGRQVERLRPRAVLIDPLYSTLSTDDYMASAAEQMLALKTMRDKFGCAFVIAHHTRKKEDTGRLGAWGSQFLNAFIETGWQIRRSEDGGELITVLRHHKVAAPQPAVMLEWKIGTDSYEVAVAGVEAIQDTTQAIVTALASKPCTIKELSDAIKVHRSTVSRKLTGMLKDGMVSREGDLWSLAAEPY